MGIGEMTEIFYVRFTILPVCFWYDEFIWII